MFNSDRDRDRDRPRRAPKTGMRPVRKKIDEYAKAGVIPDYKDIDRLKRFITPNGKIVPRRRSGLSAKMQRMLTVEVKRARHMALLPFVSNETVERTRR